MLTPRCLILLEYLQYHQQEHLNFGPVPGITTKERNCSKTGKVLQDYILYYNIKMSIYVQEIELGILKIVQNSSIKKQREKKLHTSDSY